MKKKKLTSKQWILIVIASVALLSIFWFIGSYNSLVKLEVQVDNQWANVEAVYQRRFDLIPNLVNTVQGIKDHEKEIFIGVTEARSKWTSAANTNEKAAAATGMSSALGRLIEVVENYPNIKSNENFLALQDELANTENKVSVERKRYNDVVGLFNKKIRFFPSNIVAGMFGFEKKVFFDAVEGADAPTEVNFE